MMSVHPKTAGMSGAVGAPKAEAEPAEETFEFLKLNVGLGAGDTVSCDAVAGMHLVELMRASGVPIKAECGGAGACATCHIRLVEKWRALVPAAEGEELDKLDEIPGADDTSRLACRITMTDELDGLEFEIQSDSLGDEKREAVE